MQTVNTNETIKAPPLLPPYLRMASVAIATQTTDQIMVAATLFESE